MKYQDANRKFLAMGKQFLKTLTSLMVGMAVIASAGRADNVTQGPITVIALVKVLSGHEAEFKEAAVKILAPTQNEIGNINYEFNQSVDDPTEFATSEHWESEEALSKHMVSPHMVEFFKEVGPLFAPGYPQIKKFKALKSPQIYEQNALTVDNPNLDCSFGSQQLTVKKYASRANSTGFVYLISVFDRSSGADLLTPVEARPYSGTDSYGYIGAQVSVQISKIQAGDLPYGKVRATIKIGN